MPRKAKVIATAEGQAKYGCPHCGSNEHIVQWDYIAASYGGAFAEDGVFEDDGNGAHVEWDVMLGGDHITYVCRAPKCPGKQKEWATPKRIA